MTKTINAIGPDYEKLVTALHTEGLAVIDHFLTANEVQILRGMALDIMSQSGFRPAGIGQGQTFQQNQRIRTDHIHWIDPDSWYPGTEIYPQRLDSLITALNRMCFLGIRDYELHFAWYDRGHFYRRHLDVFQQDQSRKLSVIAYLNVDWQPGDGGELVVYLPQADGAEEAREIAPLPGRLVCLDSTQIEHEVLPALQPRLSITGWLKDEKRLF